MDEHTLTARIGNETVEIPVEGEIGTGRCERIFCRLAHQAARGEAPVVEACPQLNLYVGEMGGEAFYSCGLTGHAARCLFFDLDHPDWETVLESVDLESQFRGDEEDLWAAQRAYQLIEALEDGHITRAEMEQEETELMSFMLLTRGASPSC